MLRLRSLVARPGMLLMALLATGPVLTAAPARADTTDVVEQSSRLEQFTAPVDVVQAGRDVVQPLPDPCKVQVEGGP